METLPLIKDRYQVIRHLGSGGFGETFLAEDTQMPSGRRCVVKRLKPIADNSQIYQLVQERFQREAAILEELGSHHGQIPTLYGYFRDDDHFYLVQEYIEGETLSSYLQHHGLASESTVREILVSLLPVLEYVHSKKIVHRDIKPDNIILRTGSLEPVLLDFGAVKETMGTVVTQGGHSTRSVVVGTPGFMPSEQAGGRPVYSSDLFALGLTAIYALTGKIPDELDSDPMTGIVLWRNYAPGVTPTFASILDRAIHPHAPHRFPIARQMWEALTQQSPSQASIPPTAVSDSQNTLVVSPTAVSQPPSVAPTPVPAGMPDWQKATLTGAVMGIFLIGGLVLSRPSDQDSNGDSDSTTADSGDVRDSSVAGGDPVNQSGESENSTDVAPEPTAIPTPEPTAIPTPEPPPSISQARTLGWLRIGAVQINKSHHNTGVNLIRTNQPVTISPPLMPKIGDEVIIANNVNLRVDHPKPPNYRLAEQVSVMPVGQRVIIQDLASFVDTTVDSPYPAVWAKIGVR